MPPSIASSTLEPDDANIAREWLANPQRWNDEEVVRKYHRSFADWNGSKYAFSFMGGRIALSACLSALQLTPGDEVVVPGYTCIVVPNAVRFAKLSPVYADIELDTYGMDVESFLACLTPNTKAVVIHHLFGLVCRDYAPLLEEAQRRGIYVIEDCAHATGATFKNEHVGNRGDLAFYSSEHSKIWNTGQGGMATTNDEQLGNRLSDYFQNAPVPSETKTRDLLSTFLHNYYSLAHPCRWITGELAHWKYGKRKLQSTSRGEIDGQKPSDYGCRMPPPLAALGINQLAKTNHFNQVRRETACRWDQWCRDNDLTPANIVPESVPSFLRYPVMVAPEKKLDLNWCLSELGVAPGVWFKTHLHPSDEKVRGCPNADVAVAQCINLPTILN